MSAMLHGQCAVTEVGDGFVTVRVMGHNVSTDVPIEATVDEQREAAKLLGEGILFHLKLVRQGVSSDEDPVRLRQLLDAVEQHGTTVGIRVQLSGNIMIVTSSKGLDHEAKVAQEILAWLESCRVQPSRLEEISRLQTTVDNLAAMAVMWRKIVHQAASDGYEPAVTALNEVASSEVLREADLELVEMNARYESTEDRG